MTTIREQAERLLADPLVPVQALAKKWGVTSKFLFLEEKQGRLKILRLSPKICRVRASEAARYEAESEREAARWQARKKRRAARLAPRRLKIWRLKFSLLADFL